MLQLDNVRSTISESAQEHIHEDECILTFGYSEPIESFLKAACRKRKFQVLLCMRWYTRAINTPEQLIVAEAEPGLSGHRLANELSKHSNIAVTIVPDSGVFALMARVNKVI